MAPSNLSPAEESYRWKALFGASVLLTLWLLLLPGDLLLAAKVWMASWLPYAQELDQSNIAEHTDKWVHIALFALMGGLATRAWWGHPAFRTTMLGLLAMAVGTECLQHFIPGRGASLADLMADGAGVVTGVVLWRSFLPQYAALQAGTIPNHAEK